VTLPRSCDLYVDSHVLYIAIITTTTSSPSQRPAPGTSAYSILVMRGVFRPLTQVLSHHCQHLTATSSACGTVLVLLKFSSPFRSPSAPRCLNFLAVCVSAYRSICVSTSRVTHPFRVFEVPATSSLPQVCVLSPSRFRILPRAPKLFFTPIFSRNMPSSTKKRTVAKSNNYDSNHTKQALPCRLTGCPYN